MDDWENRRLLMNMLNKIDGVDIHEDQLDKRPNFDLLLLKGDGMALFKAAFEWFYEEYRK